MKVSPSTKLICLKTIKAILSKFFDNGWIKEKFWNNIHIKIDKEVKKETKECDIEKLLSVIDQSTFIGFRDMSAIKLVYTTGIRIRTLGELRESHVDIDSLHLNLGGSIMKNHKFLKLPINEEIEAIFEILIKLNGGIRTHFGTINKNVFITQNGLPMNSSKSSNCAISKKLNK